jgi:uncharacterized phage-associated protein
MLRMLTIPDFLKLGGRMTDTMSVESASQKVGKPVNAKLVADYILILSNPDEGDLISHLKLQKLLYYCQGFHLAIHDTPLFTEPIFHWEHGPVVEAVYRQFNQYGSDALPIPQNLDLSQLTSVQIESIQEVYDVYGQFSAWKLRQMTHDEEPWLTTKDGEEISHVVLKRFFKSRLHE